MRVLIATGIFPPDIGGPAVYTEKLAAELSQRDFDIRVITYSNIKSLEPKVTRVSRKYPWRHFIYFLQLLKLAKNYDLIYAQNVTSAGLPALLTAKLLKKRLILKIVGDAAWEQQKPFLRGIQKRVAQNAHQIIVPSHYAKEMVKNWGVKAEKVNVIYNAPEPVQAINISKAEAKEKIGVAGDIILSIGRLAPWKGFNDLIDIMPGLLSENSDFQLVIVGRGKEKLKAGDRVKLVGSVPHSQIPFYFKAADVFVLNSGYEGLSHVILEAMQYEVPVIASNIGGNPELIENNVNGFLIEYGNQEQIKKAILKLWQDKDLQNKFIQNSKEKLEKFSWEKLISETLAVLKP